MSPKLGFAVSLLAACGIHGAILLIPPVATVEQRQLPSVEIDLSQAEAPRGRPAPPAEARAALPVPSAEARAVPRPAPTVPPPPTATPATEQPPRTAEPVPATSSATEQVSAAEQAPPAESAVTAPPRAAPAPMAGPSPPETGPVAASGGRGFLPPRPFSGIRPVYPLSARSSGLQGLVKVAATVEPDGEVSGLEIFASSGSAALDQAAEDAVRHARFSPATQDGVPVAFRVIVPIRFKLSPGP